MYKLLQNQAVRDFHNEINDLGWDKACEQIPAVKAAMDVNFRGSELFTQDLVKYYTHVADLDVNDMDEAFHVHNIQDESKITRYGTQHSMSVGDLLVAEDGGMYIVEGYGFGYVGNSVDEFEAGIERGMKETV